MAKYSDSPVYWHDCDSCKFLGHLLDYDMYFCSGATVATSTIILRYSNEGADYSSGIDFCQEKWLRHQIKSSSKFDSQRQTVAFVRREAFLRSITRGYLKPQDEKFDGVTGWTFRNPTSRLIEHVETFFNNHPVLRQKISPTVGKIFDKVQTALIELAGGITGE